MANGFHCTRCIRLAVFSLLMIPFVFSPQTTAAAEIKVLSDRTESHLKPLFAEFERQTGHKIIPVFMDDGLLTRLEAQPTGADVVITKNAELLEIAKKKKWLAPLNSAAIRKYVDPRFLDIDQLYFVDAYRGRVIFYSTKRVQLSDLSTYTDLKNPKWKNKICIRSGFHEYNLGLFSEFFIAFGPEKARELIVGIHNNLARDPIGNDREQAKMIMQGTCDIALINTYYHPIMSTTPDQKPWAEATGVYFPDQKQDGAFVMRSGVAMTNGKNQTAARAFVEYLASDSAETLMTNLTFQYPTNPNVPAAPAVLNLGAPQGIKGNSLKINFVPLSKMIDARDQVQKILTEISFDKK